MDYFLGNKHLGSCPNPPTHDPRLLYSHSIAFFCPKCGEVWGRVIIDPTKHHVLTRGCARCGPAWIDSTFGTFLELGDSWWNMPQLHLTPDTPFGVLMNDFLQLEKTYDPNLDYPSDSNL